MKNPQHKAPDARPGCRRVGCATVLGLLVLLAVIGALAGQGGKHEKSAEAPASPKANVPIDPQAEIKKIEVQIQMDEALVDSKGRHKVTVTAFNNSAYDFQGEIWVRSKDVSGGTLGTDALLFGSSDPLPSGKWRWANTWLKTWPGGCFEYNINGSFKGLAQRAPEGTVPIDENATKTVREKLKESFGATSWFKQIGEVTVYQDGTACILLKSSVQPSEARGRAVAALNVYTELKGVLVKAPDGTELCWVTADHKK